MTDPTSDLATQVPGGSIGEVLDWVGDDLARAQAAVTVEEAGKKRGTLLATLNAMIKAKTEPPAVEPTIEDHSRDVEPPAADDDVPCAECFPAGWTSENIARAEVVTNVPVEHVTCQHGTYRRTVAAK